MASTASAGETSYRARTVAGLLVPLHGFDLVLPNEAVAEIVDYRDLQDVPGTPPWYLGVHHWRGQEVPVICYETLNGRPPPKGMRAERTVVMNGIGGKPELPFLAIRARGIPRLLRIHSDEITPAEGKKGTADRMIAQLKDGIAHIPNISLLEQMVLRAQQG